MSSFRINKIGLDEVTLEINTYGKSESTSILKHNLLDENKNYYIGVDYLKIPLNNVGMFYKTNVELFRIVRRNVGVLLDSDLELEADVISTYTLSDQFHDVSLFVNDLNSTIEAFNQGQSGVGIEGADLFNAYGGDINVLDEFGDVPIGADLGDLNYLPAMSEAEVLARGHYRFLNFKLTGDYRLQIVGSTDFWNNFMFRFSRLGAEILGMSNTVTRTEHGNFLALTVDDGVVNDDEFVSAVGIIIPGGHSRSKSIFSECSLLQSAEQRYKITVETHLPVQSNLQIINEKETIDRSIAEVHFDSTSEIQIEFDSDGNYTSSAVENKLFYGDYPLIRKSDMNTKYTKLLTSFELRFMRFQCYVWYRFYDSLTDVWKLVKKSIDIPSSRSWTMLLRFISEV